MSGFNTGRTLSEEAKLKVSLSKLGKKRKPFSEEAKRNMSDSIKKYFLVSRNNHGK